MFNMDMNGDGREDLVVTWETETFGGYDDGLSNTSTNPQTQRYDDLGNTLVSIYFQDASGRLVADGAVYDTKSWTAGAPLFFEDFNLDGHVDFWLGSYGQKPSEFDQLVFINNGKGQFANPQNRMFSTDEAFPSWYKTSPFFFDANNDGTVDVVAVDQVFAAGNTHSIGQELRTFLSDKPAYNINGNNKFLAVLKDQTFDGGAGTDTAIFSGAFRDYTVSSNDQGHITLTDKIAGRDGTDSFVNVERFTFDDGTIALDINGTAGQAYRLYKAALDRVPDAEGLGYWISALDTGASLKNVATGFVDSIEFRNNFYGDGSNATFVRALYNNVLDRDPDQAGFDFWVNGLNNGADRAGVLVGFSESPENYSNTIGLIGGGIVYQEWVA
jgi:hypothetical protein